MNRDGGGTFGASGRRPMRKVRLTKAEIAKLRPEAKRYDVYDDSDSRGLAITVMPSGVRTWYVIRKVKGKVERDRIARVEDIDPERARKKAAKINAKIADGKSPAAERRAIRAEMTLGALWEQFKERHGPRKRSFYTDAIRWRCHLSDWQGRKLSSITRTDVNGLLERIAAASGAVSSNRVRTLLGTMYSKAREWGAEVENPVAGTRRNRETSKTRYLSPDELRRFLAAVDEDYSADTRDSLLLLLYTGVRSGTLCAARWEDLALPDALWRIPPEYMKAGRALELPLAPAAVAILNERARRAEESPWVFPGRDSKHTGRPWTGWMRVLKRAGITGLTRHDLRRTYATYALEAGVALPMIAKVLGHTMPGGVVTVYARPTPEKVREGVERTVEHLLQVAEVAAAKAKEGEVVAFPRAKRNA